MAYGSWRISTRSGDLMPVRVADGIDVRVGEAQAEVDRAPGSSLVTLLDGDGELTPTLLDIEFLAKGTHPADVFGARQALRNLEAALREADALWGAGPYEGLYLPLLEAFPAGKPLENGGREFRLPYNLVSASVKRNVLADAWAYPILDDVSPEDAGSAFYTSESEPSAPILAFTPASRWSAPASFAAMPQGTMYVGGKSEDLTWSLGSVGTPIPGTGTPSTYATGVFYNQGQYRAHAGLTTLAVPQDDAGGYGYLVMFAMSWAEYGRLSLSSFSRFGFRDHGSVALGELEPLTFRRLYAGTRIDGVGVNGFIMPGAPQFGAPFVTHRVHSAAEKRAALSAWYLNNARDVYLIPPPPYGLTLVIGDTPDVVVGREVRIPLTVERRGGFLGDIEFEVVTPDPSLRDGGIIEGDDGYALMIQVEEGLSAGTYAVAVTVRAVGQQTSAPLAAVIDTKTLDLVVRLGDPALPAGTTFFNAMYDPRNKSLATMAKNEIAGGPTVQLGGLAHWTARWDGANCDGTNIKGYGPSLAWIDTNLDMATDHSVSAQFWDVPGMAVNTVLMTFSSRTVANKLHFWQVYKAADGVRLKTNFGGATIVSGQALPLVGGLMDLSVSRDAGELTLQKPKTEESLKVNSQNWVGLGRLTFFGAKLADGTVQGLSKGIALGAAGQNRAVSTFQLERQAEYMRGYVLRTAQWERPEVPPGTYAIFLGDPGQVLRNYHPATAGQSMIQKGTGPTVTNGSFKTTGVDETGFRTGWITGSDASEPHDIFIAMRNLQLDKGGANAKFGVTFYERQNDYFRFGSNSNTIPQFFVSYRVDGETSVEKEDIRPDSGGIPLEGLQTFRQRLDPLNKSVGIRHIETGRELDTIYDNWTLAGRVQVSIGCIHRGLTSTGTIRGDTVGYESETPAECLGVIMVARHTTTQEAEDAEVNIVDSYDYSGVPVAGAGSGGSTPTPTTPPPSGGGTVVVAAGDMSAVALPASEWDATRLFGASGPMRTMSDRLVAGLNTGGYGNQSNTPLYAYDDPTAGERGQYQIARDVGMAGLHSHMALCATKDIRWAKQSQIIWNRARALFDRTSSPESTADGRYDGWGWGTSASGEARAVSYGKRIMLEAGVGAKIIVHAYNMHVNRHLDSSFEASRNQILDWWDNHYTKEWDAYWNNTKPLHSQKAFSHTTVSEIVGGFVRAKIALGDNWMNHPEGVDVINGWNLWYGNTATTTVIPVSSFRDAAWASYGPARLWGQRAQGWGGTGGQFTQSQTYLNETYGCLTFLYLEGFLKHVLGSQAAADKFMAEVVSGANLGVWCEPLRARRLVAGSMQGYLAAADHPSGVAGPWMYTQNPFGGNDTVYNSETKILVGYAPIEAFDTSQRLTTIHDDVLSRNTSARSGTSWFYVRGNITRLFAEIWRYGRKNA